MSSIHQSDVSISKLLLVCFIHHSLFLFFPFFFFYSTFPPLLELSISRASFHKAKTNLPWCVPLGEIDVTPQAQGHAEIQTEKEQGQTMKMRQKQRWWPSPCPLREKIVLALLNDFFQVNSSPNISQREISERKRRLHVYPEFPGSPWHTAHSVNQSIYCHFNSHSGCFCHQVLCTGHVAVRPPQNILDIFLDMHIS